MVEGEPAADVDRGPPDSGEPPPPSTPSRGSLPRETERSETELATTLARQTGVRLVVLALVLGAISLVYLRGQSPGGFSSLVAFVTVAAGFALSGVYAWLIRRRRLLSIIGFAQLVTDQLLCTSFVYITGGLTSGGISLYGLTCVAGAIILGWRGGLTALAAAAIAYLGLAGGLFAHLIPPPVDQVATYAIRWKEVGYPMFANLFALVVVTSLASYLAERLKTTGGDLAVATARAEQAEQLALLGKLAAGLAHEIRNPLGAIAGSVELIASSPGLSEEDRYLCQLVRRETERLNELVGDMLDLSRARSPMIEAVDLALVAREVVSLAGQSWRGGDVTVSYRGNDSASVRGDGSQLRQVVWNLVRNAMQVSSPGDEVEVTVELRKERLELTVHDEGPGIPESARAQLFDAFFTTRSHGTGVGLAVVKRIVEDHGFAIEVASSSKGATFRIIVPQAARIPSA